MAQTEKLEYHYVVDNDPNLRYIRKLGSGGFGSVHEIFDIPGKKSSARKVLHMPSIEKRILEREVKAIKKLCGPAAHPNIVQVVDHGLLWSCDFYYIDMELCNMSLDDYLHPKKALDASPLLPCFVKGGGSDSLVQMWTIMSQIARGVDYIHRQHKIHRDIKPANILYSSETSLWKLADFGLSVDGSSNTNRPTRYSRGSQGYRAPELMAMDEEPALYTNKVDIWAMGCILYELATGNRAFKSDWAVSSYVHSAKSIEVPLDTTFNVDSIKIITQHIVDMLQATPTARPSASILSTEFDHQLQLAQESVQLSAVNNSVSTLAITEGIEENPAKPLKPEVADATNPVVNLEVKQTTSRLRGDIVPSNSPGNDAEPLLPHLRRMSLYEAAENGHLDVVKALIAAKRDVNAQGGKYGNALQVASFKGFEAVVRLLLGKGADVNAQGGRFGNALQAALRKGSEAVVQLLLEGGAFVNAQGGYFGNALQAASWRGLEAVVRLLLEKGAEVNAQGGYYGTALQAASSYGSKAVVRLLLEKGAEVNAQGGNYGSALRAASKHGNFAVMRLLEANGAKE